jgi:hypothetical protein
MTTILYGYAAFTILAIAYFALRYVLRTRADRRSEATNVVRFRRSSRPF